MTTIMISQYLPEMVKVEMLSLKVGKNGIIAVGNSEMEVRGFDCEIIPGTTSKGNAEIEIDCGVPSEDSDE